MDLNATSTPQSRSAALYVPRIHPVGCYSTARSDGSNACSCRRGEFNPEYTRALERGVGCSLTASTFASSRSGHRDVGMREVVTYKQQRLSEPP